MPCPPRPTCHSEAEKQEEVEESQEQAVNLDLSAAGAAGNMLGAIDQKNDAVVRGGPAAGLATSSSIAPQNLLLAPFHAHTASGLAAQLARREHVCPHPPLQMTINAQGIIQMANKVAIQLLGYKKGELEGKNVSCIMPQPFSSRHNGYLRNFVTTGERAGPWPALATASALLASTGAGGSASVCWPAQQPPAANSSVGASPRRRKGKPERQARSAAYATNQHLGPPNTTNPPPTPGKAKILDSVREVVALHKERYVFPLRLVVTRVSGAGQDSLFMGVLRVGRPARGRRAHGDFLLRPVPGAFLLGRPLPCADCSVAASASGRATSATHGARLEADGPAGLRLTCPMLPPASLARSPCSRTRTRSRRG